MDTPDPENFGELVALVGDKEKWAKWRKGRAWARAHSVALVALFLALKHRIM